MLPITRKISAFNHSDVNTHEFLVIHDTGNVTDSDEGNASYFGSADRQASAHYFVDDNSITQVVEDYEASWNCGDGAMKYGIGNHNSLSIEMCRVNNTVTPTTEANTVELAKYLMAKYSIPIDKVVRHYDASRKLCPESFDAIQWARWIAFKAKLTGAVSKPTVVGPTPSADTLWIQKTLNQLVFVGANGKQLTEDGLMGSNTTFAIKKFQSVVGLTPDGVVGTNTKGAINTILAKPVCKQGVTAPIPVKYIQYRLGITADGSFGPTTKAHVISFQRTQGLQADGVVGPNTWSRLLD